MHRHARSYKSAKLLDTKCENGVPIAAKEPQPDQTDKKKPAGAGSIPLNRPTMSLEAVCQPPCLRAVNAGG